MAPPWSIWKVLTKDKAASIFIRLAKSEHVADLQLIFWMSCILMLVGSIFIMVWHKSVGSTGVIGSGAVIGGIVGVGCGVLTWTYQTGSARLGIVDLFACEITTICRVMTIAETAPRYVQVYRHPPQLPMNFNSQEHHSPVFDNNSKDLEALEARVVERVTEFYTYLKALRDYLRTLNAIERSHDQIAQWRQAMGSVIYMLFLMLESARKSVERLIEYESERAQNTITILLSELVVYGLLVEIFEEDAQVRPGYDARAARLRLRKDDYLKLGPVMYSRANAERDHEEWKAAATLIVELNHRYHDIFGEWIDDATVSSHTLAAPKWQGGLGNLVTTDE